MIKVAIVEDNADIRNGLELLINSSEGYSCVSSSPTGEQALIDIPVSKPDVVLMDINLPGISGIECISLLKPNLPGTQYLMCTVYEDDEQIFNALKVGATGYILKKTRPESLLEAIDDINAGGSPMTSQIARKVVASMQGKASSGDDLALLTKREKEILDLLSMGYRYKDIAERLHLSVETIRTHIRNIYEKLQVNSRTQAINKAYPKG